MPSETFIFSSNPDNGATDITNNGSKFSVQFVNPLFLPANAYNAKLEVIQANIWNMSPNVSQALGNNTFTITDKDGAVTNKHTVVLADGLYDIDSIYDSLAYAFDNLPTNRPRYPFKDYFLIDGNQAINRLFITFRNNTATSGNEVNIIWEESSLRTLLGFDENSPTKPSQPSNASHEYSLVAPNASLFNNYNSFMIHTDLVSQGIQLNNLFDNVVAQIQITEDPGGLERFRAVSPNMFAIVNNLIGSQNARYRATFWLTSETGVALDMRGEYYDFCILISWLESE